MNVCSSIWKLFSSPSSVKASLVFLKSSASFTPSMKMFSPKDVKVKSSALAERQTDQNQSKPMNCQYRNMQHAQFFRRGSD